MKTSRAHSTKNLIVCKVKQVQLVQHSFLKSAGIFVKFLGKFCEFKYRKVSIESHMFTVMIYNF